MVARSTMRDLGVLERVGRKHILSGKFYSFAGRPAEYTRKKGLDRETQKELLLSHLRDNNHRGAPMAELMEVLPNLGRNQVWALMRQMKRDGLVHVQGRTRAARWYSANAPLEEGR